MFADYRINHLIPVKETEKAIAVKGWKTYNGSRKTYEVAVWIPKSIIKDGEIPAWFINKTQADWRLNDYDIATELA